MAGHTHSETRVSGPAATEDSVQTRYRPNQTEHNSDTETETTDSKKYFSSVCTFYGNMSFPPAAQCNSSLKRPTGT